MTDACSHGFAIGKPCPMCGIAGADEGNPSSRRSVYEDRIPAPRSEEWRKEQLASIGIGYGWRPLSDWFRR